MRASLSTIGSFRFPGFIVLLVLFVFLPLLTSCSMPNAQENRLRHGAAPEELSAGMEFTIIGETESAMTIGVLVRNPARIPVRSVRSWVRFDPLVAQVRDLSVPDDRFLLFAPGERTVDQAEGFIKLGAAVREPITDRELLFATFSVSVLGGRQPATDSGRPVLTFYDWRAEGDGHTAVLSVEERRAVNILDAPSSLQL